MTAIVGNIYLKKSAVNNIHTIRFVQLEVEETGEKVRVIRGFELAKNKIKSIVRNGTVIIIINTYKHKV